MEAGAVKSVGLRKVYRSKEAVEALKGVSIDVGKGELFTLLGPNGAGKPRFCASFPHNSFRRKATLSFTVIAL